MALDWKFVPAEHKRLEPPELTDVERELLWVAVRACFEAIDKLPERLRTIVASDLCLEYDVEQEIASSPIDS